MIGRLLTSAEMDERKFRAFPHDFFVASQTDQAVDIDVTFDAELPDWLRGTKRHNGGTRLVDVLSVNGKPLRTMVFRGVVPETDAVAVSTMKPYGCDHHFHLVSRNRVVSKETSDHIYH